MDRARKRASGATARALTAEQKLYALAGRVPGYAARSQQRGAVAGAAVNALLGFAERKGFKPPTFANWDPRLLYGGAAVFAVEMWDAFGKGPEVGLNPETLEVSYSPVTDLLRGASTHLLAAGLNRAMAAGSMDTSRVSVAGYFEPGVSGYGYGAEIDRLGPGSEVGAYGYGAAIDRVGEDEAMADEPEPDDEPMSLAGYGYGGDIQTFDTRAEYEDDEPDEGEL